MIKPITFLVSFLLSISCALADDLGEHEIGYAHNETGSYGVALPPADLLANIDTAGNLDTRDTRITPLAFPGATGPAADITGGRGAPIFVVNTLDNSITAGDGKISFQEFIEGVGDVGNGPRNATFSISGEIDSGFISSVQLLDSDISIFCHTAPDPGIVFSGYKPLEIKNDADNIIVRFCRFRPRDTGLASKNQVMRAVNITGGGNGVAPDGVYLNHISAGYSTDENITVFTGTNTTVGVASKITIDQFLIEGGAATCLRGDNECGSTSSDTNGGVQGSWAYPNHSMCISVSSTNGTSTKDLAVVGGACVSAVARSPHMRGVFGGDVRNNIFANIYGISVNLTVPNGGAPARGWITGNIFKHGPDTNNPADQINTGGGDSNFYIRDNTQITYEGVGVDGVQTPFGDDANDINLPGIIRYTDAGHNQLNLACSGASVPSRDPEDRRLFNEINGTGVQPVSEFAEIGIGARYPWDEDKCGAAPGQPENKQARCFYSPPSADGQYQRDYSHYAVSNSHPVGYDTDNDGIPDSFENEVIALDPNDAFEDLTDIDHSTTHADGYTYFEKWTHNLAAECARGET